MTSSRPAAAPSDHIAPRRPRGPRLSVVVLLFLLAIFPASPARAQGCAQCKDNTAAMPASAQAGYRKAIVLLGLSAAAVFTASLIVLRRDR